MNFVLGVSSNIQVCYYSSTAAEEIEPKKLMFVTVDWSVFSWEPNS